MSQPRQTEPLVVRTALVVDDSAAARQRAATLLRLAGWEVVEAVGTEAALRMAAIVDFDLVVTEMAMRNGHGATLLRKLRESGSRARFVVTATRRTHQVRALASSAGAVACLAKPVDPRVFVDVMHGLAPVVGRPVETSVAATADARQRTEEMHVSALPHRLAAIAAAARDGDALTVARLTAALATVGDRLGWSEVARAARAITADAGRGFVPQVRLMELVGVCSQVEGARWEPVAQATPAA